MSTTKTAHQQGNGWSVLETVFVGLIGFGVSTLVSIVFIVFSAIIFGEDIVKNLAFNLFILVTTNVVFLGVIWLYLRSKSITLKKMGLKKPKAKSWLMLVPVFVGYVLVAFVLDSTLRFLFPDLNLDQEQDIIFKNASGVYQVVVAGLALLVIAPITEELIYRGFIYKGFRGKLGFFWAALISSLLFGVAHGQVNVAIDTFILGLFLCFLYEKSQSIWLAVALHALKNGIAFYLIFFTDIAS